MQQWLTVINLETCDSGLSVQIQVIFVRASQVTKSVPFYHFKEKVVVPAESGLYKEKRQGSSLSHNVFTQSV